MTALRRRGLLVDDPLAARERDASVPTDDAAVGAERLRDIPLEQIRPNADQPRKRFDEAALASLADSIRERGVLQPVIVKPAGSRYELVAGERR